MPKSDLIQSLTEGDLRALSIRQPWVHHIIHDGKDIENRSWKTDRRGWFLIHASKAWDGSPGYPKDAPRGGIVGAARIVGCVEESASRWFMGPYGFELAEPLAIPLVPCKGALGFFRPDEEVLSEVRRAFERNHAL